MLCNIDVKDLMNALRHGRELEFTWKKNRYSIHCKYPLRWFLTSVDADITFEADSIDSLLDQIHFGDRCFFDIFPDMSDVILY